MKEYIDEEIALELIDMLSVALYFAGVKKDCMQKAIDLYLKALDEHDESEEYNQESIIKIIKNLKKNHKDIFRTSIEEHET